jgi:hypothetical protein
VTADLEMSKEQILAKPPHEYFTTTVLVSALYSTQLISGKMGG